MTIQISYQAKYRAKPKLLMMVKGCRALVNWPSILQSRLRQRQRWHNINMAHSSKRIGVVTVIYGTWRATFLIPDLACANRLF